MENKDLLKGMENASVYREMFLTRKMTGAGDKPILMNPCMRH